jgi:predicted Fe-Mo cluster-binding NifX family protein
MNLCIPVNSDSGLASEVCPHFGSAPCFLIVDTDSLACRAIANTVHQQGRGGGCAPLHLLDGQAVDAMVVGGIGMGALNKLRAANIQVLVSTLPTVKETITAFKAGTLQSVGDDMVCAAHGPQGHGHGPGGCGGNHP